MFGLKEVPSNTVRVIPRFVPTPDTVKHSMTNSAYRVLPESPAPFTRRCCRSDADDSTNESTGAAPRSQSWPPLAVTYTALLSASNCGDVTNGSGEEGGGGGGPPIQQSEHKGKFNVASLPT
jgi:hypothetical protein